MVGANEAKGAKEREAYLMLNRIPGASAARATNLLAVFGEAQAVFRASVGELRAAGLSDRAIQAIRQPDPLALEADLRWLEQANCGVLFYDGPGYPALLNQISSPPLLLFYRGRAEVLSLPQLAVIGARQPSAAGAENAFEFARAFTEMGLVVTSGLAQGIDTQAHLGALDVDGVTVAVIGTGPDRVYPAKNRDLAHKICENGVIVSEFSIGTPPRRENFPRRNRILSGLTLSVLVVEAAKQSGTLITARYALEQGREVFAIPGSIHNPLAKGCHALIKQGAKLVETAEDVLQEIAPQLAPYLASSGVAKSRSSSSSDEAVNVLGLARAVAGEVGETLLKALRYDSCSVDLLQQRTGFKPELICSTLVILEIEGYVVPAAGGNWQRINFKS